MALGRDGRKVRNMSAEQTMAVVVMENSLSLSGGADNNIIES
eukprot:CAMPEP_0183729188 /NCGR_PEP_ID=MMETSP0737-20130205/29912_1 /TAXON_ID=385413 /ORGANISM="Thalassiosira miniscula, Strain CCMP1093" /LENGTH=41 /DNA_ID= /DNA_START= /DNA_END= /DNA_ORIENTATION=